MAALPAAALAFVISRERPRRARVAGLFLGVCGAALFLASARPDAETPHRLLGDLVLMAAAVVWGMYTIVGRPLMAAGGPMRTTTWVVATGTVVLIALGLPVAAGSGIDWAAQPPDLWLAILFLGAISTGIGYSFYYRGIRDLGPTSAALAMLLLPLTGAVASIVLLGESLAPLQVAGSLVMAAGAVIAILCDHRIMAKGAARIGLNEVQVGLYPGETIFRCYERILGTAKATNFLIRGAMLTADEALAAGLVDELVEPDQVIARAVALGEEIAALPPMTYRKTRAMARADLVRIVEHPTESLASLMQAGWITDETRERMAGLLR